MHPPEGNGDWTQEGIDQLIDLVLLQGNRFIREFLRSKKLRLGTTKPHFEENLRVAIADGRLAPADIQEWLQDVEGWGNQHAFVYSVPEGSANGLRSLEAFAERVAAANLEGLLDAPIPLDPPEELTLATVRHRADGISLLWVRGSAALSRRPDLNYEEVVDGDEIEYHAYERRWSRVAARFEWHFDRNVAAVLLARRDERDYAEQRAIVLHVVDLLIEERATWVPLDISRVITRLDAAGLDATEDSQGGVRINNTVFQGAAASVRLAASAQDASYQDDAAVRQVRLAVDPAQFVGSSGDCYLTPSGDDEFEKRELHLRLYGRERRVLLWGKMVADEVWRVITDLQAHASA